MFFRISIASMQNSYDRISGNAKNGFSCRGISAVSFSSRRGIVFFRPIFFEMCIKMACGYAT